MALLHTSHSAVLNRNLFTSLLRCLVLCAVELVHPLHQLCFYIPGSVLFDEMFSILYPLPCNNFAAATPKPFILSCRFSKLVFHCDLYGFVQGYQRLMYSVGYQFDVSVNT